MLIPIRCFSCGKPISHLYSKYESEMKSKKDSKKAFKELGITRQCCKAVLLGTTDMTKTVGRFRKR